MIKVNSDREFKLVRNSYSVFKKNNLKKIGFNQISGTNLYKYESDEYKILNYSIKPQLIFLINIEDDNTSLKLKEITIQRLPNILKTLNLNIVVNVFSESDFYRITRHISLEYKDKNKFIRFLSENFINKFLNNLMEIISIRFDRKLIKKLLKVI